MSKYSITILGGDLRQCYLAKYLQENGYHVTCFGTMMQPEIAGFSLASCLSHALSNADFILCPTPFLGKNGLLYTTIETQQEITMEELSSKLQPGQVLFGGSIPPDFVNTCNSKQVTVWDYMTEESFICKNAALTAEGLLPSLITHTPFSLKNKRVLILGYGHCGKEIAHTLSSFHMDISILDELDACLALALKNNITPYTPESINGKLNSFDLIINTIPARILNSAQLGEISQHCILFDIASAPFGFDIKATEILGLTMIRCPGIPGKIMPQTAGEFIGKVILERILSYAF